MSTIAIDALGIVPTGGGRSATLNVLREVLRTDRENRYILLLDAPEPTLTAAGDHVREVLAPVHQPIAARLWAQVVWPIQLRSWGVDLVHHMKNLAAAWLPGRSVVTVYDLTTVVHPEFFPRRDVLYWRHVEPVMLRAADAVIAISEQTKQDIVSTYRVDPERVRVIYPAYDPRFSPADSAQIAAAREAYDTGARFVLHVGSLSKKKNLLTLLMAFEMLCGQGYDGKLVLVGRQYSKGRDDAFYEHLLGSPYRERVVLAGSVPDGDLPPLYSAAEIVVFPSLHEGFGIVPLEAMACGTAVITSRAGALPEVVGDGALTVANPEDAEELAAAAGCLLYDASLREEQARRGAAQARRYSACEAAHRTLDLYRALLGAGD